jgi:hypothetical protein
VSDALYEPHEFTYQCMSCGTKVRINSLNGEAPKGAGIVRIKGESGVPISPGHTHGVALENGAAEGRQPEGKWCGGLGQMVFMSSRRIVQAAPVAASPPPGWLEFCDKVHAGWQAFKSDWDLRRRGINNRDTPGYVRTPKAITDFLAKQGGQVTIKNGVYQVSSSDTAGMSLKRALPPTATVPANVKSFIYHL